MFSSLCFFFIRLSFITEQVAAHTNGTIGALLNATFGNAPELLISAAALRAGYFRVVQLAMLGSMLTNMILVFGIACIIGGLRWQVQELRIVSGNVNVVMLLVATAGSLFPAALKLSGQIETLEENSGMDSTVFTHEEVAFCRVNAAVMLILYLLFLFFQLKTHKEEYDEEQVHHNKHARRNLACIALCNSLRKMLTRGAQPQRSALSAKRTKSNRNLIANTDMEDTEYGPDSDDQREGVPLASKISELLEADHPVNRLPRQRMSDESLDIPSDDELFGDSDEEGEVFGDSDDDDLRHRNKSNGTSPLLELPPLPAKKKTHKSKDSDRMDPPNEAHDEEEEEPLISMRIGVIWLFIITVCISAMSDILVDTIDGFAQRMRLSEVFTSMVIIPFFSNIAEQVSAFLFAYRNEMDLCVGVTVGSAIQIATFVLPGSVIMGYFMDEDMTLFFRGYETVSLFFAVVVVGAILQGGTTNWMTGSMLVGIYTILVTGIWFHEREHLSIRHGVSPSNMTGTDDDLVVLDKNGGHLLFL